MSTTKYFLGKIRKYQYFLGENNFAILKICAFICFQLQAVHLKDSIVFLPPIHPSVFGGNPQMRTRGMVLYLAIPLDINCLVTLITPFSQ